MASFLPLHLVLDLPMLCGGGGGGGGGGVLGYLSCFSERVMLFEA